MKTNPTFTHEEYQSFMRGADVLVRTDDLTTALDAVRRLATELMDRAGWVPNRADDPLSWAFGEAEWIGRLSRAVGLPTPSPADDGTERITP